MAENKMTEVAKVFGKELGEEFYVMYYRKRKARFTLQGVEFYRTGNRLGLGKWVLSEGVLEYLITGKAVIVDEPHG